MIIGKGLIASAFASYFIDDPEVFVFASGVSNSRENKEKAFLRERKMLTKTLHSKRFIIYFSTCSVNDPELLNTPYVVHKKQMESLVCSSQHYAIFRLPQVVGNTENPHTLTNYIYNQIKSGFFFEVWRHAKRNLIDVDDVARIVAYLVKESSFNKTIINVACPFSISIPQLISTFELITGQKAKCEFVEAGGSYHIDSNYAIEVAKQLGIIFDEFYIEKLIRKYYGG